MNHDGNSARDPSVPLIVSVDCGITAVEPARVARELGVDLIITDHHDFDPAQLPDAFVLVHPRVTGGSGSGVGDRGSGVGMNASPATNDASGAPSDASGITHQAPRAPYPFADLCGAGVAFKLAWHLARTWCGSQRLPADLKHLMLELLSLAALGTVADVAPLVGENRIITRFGLGRIKHTRFVGLNALIDAANLRDEKIDAYHVGFVLGPRLNACGRMGHAARAVHLLTEAQPADAIQTAHFLTRENDRRRSTERQIARQAEQMARDAGYDGPDHRAIVLCHEGWHPGVLGIVASRLVERFCRPVVMLNDADGEAHGSARSVEGLCLHEALQHCAAHLTSFGGHAMAAGMRLRSAHVDAFRQALVEYVNAHLSADDLIGVIDVDADCEPDQLSLELFEQIAALAPFGRGNPHPRLCVRHAVLDEHAMPIGSTGQHLRLWLRCGGRRLQAVAFGMGDLAGELRRGVELDVVFEPKVSTWQGRKQIELHVKDILVLTADAPSAAQPQPIL